MKIAKELIGKSLDELLEIVEVLEDVNDTFPVQGWYAVGNHVGIIAYFEEEEDACAFRMAYINTCMNTVVVEK